MALTYPIPACPSAGRGVVEIVERDGKWGLASPLGCLSPFPISHTRGRVWYIILYRTRPRVQLTPSSLPGHTCIAIVS